MSFYEDRRMEYQLTVDVGASGRAGTVHVAMRKVVANTGQTPWPHYTLCGANSGDRMMVKTAREVTCKRCLRRLAAENAGASGRRLSPAPARSTSPSQRLALTDAAGTVIRVGDTVKQADAGGHPWESPERGALVANAGRTGTVVALGRTRAKVDFGRTKSLVFGSVGTDEPVLDAVSIDMLLVVAPHDG